MGLVSSGADSPNELGMSNPSWGDVSSSDEVASEAYLAPEPAKDVAQEKDITYPQDAAVVQEGTTAASSVS